MQYAEAGLENQMAEDDPTKTIAEKSTRQQETTQTIAAKTQNPPINANCQEDDQILKQKLNS